MRRSSMKNLIIGVLTGIIDRNICVTSNSDAFAIGFGAVCMAGCVYFAMKEVDRRCAKKGRRF